VRYVGNYGMIDYGDGGYDNRGPRGGYWSGYNPRGGRGGGFRGRGRRGGGYGGPRPDYQQDGPGGGYYDNAPMPPQGRGLPSACHIEYFAVVFVINSYSLIESCCNLVIEKLGDHLVIFYLYKI
jgi:hypothetical protein